MCVCVCVGVCVCVCVCECVCACVFVFVNEGVCAGGWVWGAKDSRRGIVWGHGQKRGFMC